jgi:hypothetical protein
MTKVEPLIHFEWFENFSIHFEWFENFSIHFEWFEIWWVHQLVLYKTSFYSKDKDATIKDFKLKVRIYFNSPVTKHWTPLHQTTHILTIPLSNWAMFVMLEAVSGRLQMLFELQKLKHNV